MSLKTSSLIGTGIGLVAYLAAALLPSLLYGGYAGVLLAGGIFGTPIQPTLLVQALIVFGMAMSALGVASLFMVAGAALGGAIDALTARAGALRVGAR